MAFAHVTAVLCTRSLDISRLFPQSTITLVVIPNQVLLKQMRASVAQTPIICFRNHGLPTSRTTASQGFWWLTQIRRWMQQFVPSCFLDFLRRRCHDATLLVRGSQGGCNLKFSYDLWCALRLPLKNQGGKAARNPCESPRRVILSPSPSFLHHSYLFAPFFYSLTTLFVFFAVLVTSIHSFIHSLRASISFPLPISEHQSPTVDHSCRTTYHPLGKNTAAI